MKKFKFSLQKVLEIKEQLLKNMKDELNYLNQQIKRIEGEITCLRNKYSETNKEFVEKSSVSMTIGEMSYYKIFMNNILKDITKKEEEKEIVNKKIEAKKLDIIEMNKEISSLEKLRDKELEKYNEGILKSEEIFIDEFVSNKTTLKQYMF